MSDNPVNSVVIVGGGTAGWIAASMLARQFLPGAMQITLIESDDIGIVGVGEATVPVIRQLNALLGIDENAFVAATQGSFKLGIEFRDWGTPGNVHFHGFGDYGAPIEGVAPHHHWLKLRASGEVRPIEAWSFPAAAAQRGKFAPPAAMASMAGEYNYAYHFDAARYARFLRTRAEAMGVERVEGQIDHVALCSETGQIRALTLADGREIAGDLFVDCSGFAALLIEGALGTGYHDWSHWLPADRALAVPTQCNGPPAPYTRSTAREAGWQWRIPLQHREGNGHVFASGFTSEARAQDVLLANLPGEPLAEPRLLRFRTGHRHRWWNRNCVAIGLAGGFMEPLESTSIQLIQTGVARLIDLFPTRAFDPALAEEYNRVTTNEYARIRDFLIAHYHFSKREEPLWAYCRAMRIPDTLAHKIEVWQATGRVPMLSEESYSEPSWAAILLGNGVIPRRYDPRVDRVPDRHLAMMMARLREDIDRAADTMPAHAAWIARHCDAGVPA